MLMQVLTDLREQLAELLRTKAEYCVIAFGLIVFVGAWRDWEWITSPRNIPRSSLFQQFLFEAWGGLAYRIFLGICGLLAVVYGVLYLLYGHGKL